MSDVPRILLVDDEAELTEPLRLALGREGYAIDTAEDGTAGTHLALAAHYDLLILDWMLPGRSGLEICQQLRSRGNLTPVLFLTARDTLDDRVEGLDAGADDYLVKPFELRELLARVRALLRRERALANASDFSTGKLCQRLQAGDAILEPENQILYRGRRSIQLSEKECKLLAYLMARPGRAIDREELYQHLWNGDEKPSSNVLPALVRLLRRKIAIAGEIQLIQTVYGRGYRFDPDG